MLGLANKRRRKIKRTTGIQGFGVPLASAGLIAVVGVWSYASIEQSLKRELANELTTILEADVAALRLWVAEQEHTVGVRANETRVRKLVGDLVELAARETTTPDVLLHSTTLRALREYLEPMCRTHGYIGFVVTDRRGVNVGALLDEPVGQRSLADHSDFVERALAGETLVCRPFPGEVLLPDEQGVFRAGRPTMFAAAPVRDQGGQIIATLSFRIRPGVDFTRILSVARSGETGETYAFDSEGLLLSTSRFDAQLKEIGLLPDRVGVQSNLRIQIRDPGGNMLDGFRPAPEQELPLTRMAAEAVVGHSSVDVDGYRDYRGVPVVGAWIWLPEYGFGVATEMDRAEACGPLTQARRAFAVTVGLLLLTAGVGLLLERKNRKAVAALRDSVARNRTIMECAPDGIVTIDERGIVESFNPAAERIFGYTAREVLGRNVAMLMPTPDRERHDEYLRRYLETGARKAILRRREVLARRRDGSTFALELNVSEVRVGDRRIFTGIVRDITERKRTENLLRTVVEGTSGETAEDFFRSLVRRLATGLGVRDAFIAEAHDPSRECLRTLALWSGAEFHENIEYSLAGTPCENVVGRDVCCYPSGVQARFPEDVLLKEMGVEGYLGVPLFGSTGESLGILALMHDRPLRDVSRAESLLRIFAARAGAELERLRAEAELRNGNKTLIDALDREKRISVELEAAMEQLEAANQTSQAANQSKSEFLANMSHEIRTPMTAIMGYTDLAIEESRDCDRTLELLAVVKRNGEHLLQIINDILDLSKIEAGRLDVERIDCSPARLAAEVQSLMNVRAAEKGLTFSVEYDGPVPQTIPTDPTRLRQILLNLVGNAIKFTKRGGVRLVLRLLRDDEGREARMQFDVVDTGVGIDPTDAAALFQPFTQADSSTTRRHGGTGLGLTISRRLAAILGGDILVKSEPGRGSTFSVVIAAGPVSELTMLDSADDLPAASTPVADSDVPGPGKGQPLSCRILLVEDGPDNQRLISAVLERAGARVTVAENGRIGVERALEAVERGAAYDVVLMDMQMPVLDGYGATRELRAAGYRGPILALTAHAMSADRKRCLDAGCDEFATKPINRRMLIEIVRRHIPSCAETPAET